MIMTLRELCNTYGVSRRAVQGYEHLKLIAPSGKNKMGHLLYDEPTQEKVKLIKFYQDIGFQLKDIQNLINSSPDEIIKSLEHQLEKLNNRKDELDSLIRETQELIKKMRKQL